MSKILIAEDDQFLVSAYKLKFTKLGYEVLVALDGNEALDILQKNSDLKVMLLDLMMPNKDGFETLSEIKKLNLKVSVVVASNLGQKEDIDKALALGAVDYVVKSDSPIEEIVKKIQKYM